MSYSLGVMDKKRKMCSSQQ